MDWHAGKCRRYDAAGRLVADGSCRVALSEDGVMLEPGEFLYYSDMERVDEADYTIDLPLFDGRRYELYFLGRWHGQCVADLRRLRGAQLTRNLLMLDGVPEKEFRGAYSFEAPDGRAHADEASLITLYRSSLVVEPLVADCWNLAYADITAMAFDQVDYVLRLQTDLDELVGFRMLGTRFGELQQEITRLTEAMYARTAALLRGLLPESVRDVTVQRLARLLRQGKAVPLEQVKALGVWPELSAVMFTVEPGADGEAGAGAAETGSEAGGPDKERQAAFAHLCSLAAPSDVFVGLRENFESDRPVFWFVVAFPSAGRMAVEVTNEAGNATYIYRMEGPVDKPVTELCRAMVALNFRREVISASEKELAGERMARYRVALRKLPYVRRMRELFVGKAAHSGQAAWQRRVGDLLGL